MRVVFVIIDSDGVRVCVQHHIHFGLRRINRLHLVLEIMLALKEGYRFIISHI